MASVQVTSEGIPVGVIGAAIVAGVGLLPGIGAFDDPVEPAELLSLGWPAFGVVAALSLDREPRSRLGWVLVALAMLPAIVAFVAQVAPLDGDFDSRLGAAWDALGIVPLMGSIAVIGWALGLAPDRLSRRRLTWFAIWAGLVVAAVVIAGQLSRPLGSAAATMIGLWALVCALTLLTSARELRPVDEPLVDAAALAGVLAIGAAAGVLMRWVGQRGHIPAPGLTGGFVAAIACAFVAPGSWWARRQYLERRYGTGEISPNDLATITGGLAATDDPIELLSRAATLVVAASGHRAAVITVGDGEPDVPAHWLMLPLAVGHERVGTLALDPLHREGPEPRQRRIVAQLLPTVALVTRAVVLAVEAERARADLARERETERARILGDLHDGVGPALAGLRMRVQARSRTEPSEWLDEVVSDLAAIRDDLRRLVRGLTPAALDDGDLAAALTGLVGSFRDGGADVTLNLRLDTPPRPDASVALYRFVAEGITNAIRHASASAIAVSVHAGPHTVEAAVVDDGQGGPLTPGTGLASLRKRAADLGGSLSIEPSEPTGTSLRMMIPT